MSDPEGSRLSKRRWLRKLVRDRSPIRTLFTQPTAETKTIVTAL